jgi:biopolymer transport protein ExbD
MTESLSPAQRSKIRRLSTSVAAEPGEDGGELNVVPYLDIITNIMMFVLATVTVTFAASVPVSAAQTNARPGPVTEALSLTALVTSQGVALKTSGGPIAPGCGGVGPGVTVPRSGGEHDLVALTACARRIKSARAEHASETQVAVTASPDVPYQAVVAVMDALRADADGPLFPDVRLGVVR